MKNNHNSKKLQESLPENQQKYLNYKVQKQRLNKALDNGFYLEAIFIEYVILEDRTASVLRYEGNSIKPKNENGYVSIDAKVKKIVKISENQKGVPHKYFTADFMNKILVWKEKRNSLMHALMKRSTTTDELKSMAEEGLNLVKDLLRISQNYKRYLERHKMLKG